MALTMEAFFSHNKLKLSLILLKNFNKQLDLKYCVTVFFLASVTELSVLFLK